MHRARLACLVFACLLAPPAAAQHYAAKPVRLISPYPPGLSSNTPVDFAASIETEGEKWTRVIRAASIRTE